MKDVFFIIEKGTYQPELGPYSLHCGRPFDSYEDAYIELKSWTEDDEKDYVNGDEFFIVRAVSALKIEKNKLSINN